MESAPVITEDTAREIDRVFEVKEKEAEERVEAILFIAGRFMNSSELMHLAEIDEHLLKKAMNSLERKYSSGAIKLVSRGNSWKLDVAEKYKYLINRLATGESEFSKAEQETLAVIAYKQPVKQSVIIKIRGNKAYDHIKRFRELGLLNAKRVGHTLELSLSEEFYEYFDIQDNKINKL